MQIIKCLSALPKERPWQMCLLSKPQVPRSFIEDGGPGMVRFSLLGDVSTNPRPGLATLSRILLDEWR